MKHLFLLLSFTVILLFSGCHKRRYANPGPSLIYLTFNNEISNKGILPVEFHGGKYVSFTQGISDTCLNLTSDALYRKPIIVDKGYANSFSDYEGITVLFWTKTGRQDPFEYVIAGQKLRLTGDNYRGWHINKTITGGWQWVLNDGMKILKYLPPVTQQPINDDHWHLVGFSIDKRSREARLYYDGNLKALYSLEGIGNPFPGTALYIGSDPMAQDPRIDTYNGMIDELGIWSRALSDDQVAGFYRNTCGKKLKPMSVFKDSVTVMTWNIRNGGVSQGKYVGVKRIAEIIRQSGADIVALQETRGAGEIIAGELDYYFYSRSSNLSILSRFAPVKSYNAFRPLHFGAVQLNIGKGENILAGPVWLSRQPNLSAYFMKDNARTDTIEEREMETRGRETNFLLSEIRPLIQKTEQTPIVIAGDFNSGSHLDWTERNKDRYNNLVVDFPASQFMSDAGFLDAYRQVYPNEVTFQGHTWLPVYKEGLQIRMDFIYFKGEKLVPSTAKVIDTSPFGFPSDHGAVVVSFMIKKESLWTKVKKMGWR